MRFGLKLSILIALIAALTLAGCDNGSGDPIEVGSLTAAPADGAVTLNWTDPGVDYTAVEITFSPAAGGVTQPITVPKGTNTKTISGLANSTLYAFTVQLVYSSGYKSPGKTVTATPADPAPPATPYVLPDPTNPDIAAKFGVSTVSDAFTNLHLLISTPEPDDDFTAIIALGDYIDLPSLTVAGYPTDAVDTGSGSAGYGMGKITATNTAITATPFAGYEGRLLRLIVVGINSFNGKNGNNIPHVVFQFQNLPGIRRMNPTDTNVGGYKDSEMRKYLVEVGGAGGNFLAGLTAAGVPAGVLWAPKRMVWNGYTQAEFETTPAPTTSGNTNVDEIADKLFLPTEWEMFGSNPQSNGTYEKNDNQGRFTYYIDVNHRIKYDSGNTATGYWEASPRAFWGASHFCRVPDDGGNGGGVASNVRGCAPAFCVK